MNIGERIAELRKLRGWTQEELAERMGYKSKSTINKIELGVNDISQSKVVEFAKVLETTPEYLMGWSDNYVRLHKNFNLQFFGEKKNPVPPERQALIDELMKCSDEELKAMLKFAEMLKGK